MFGEAALREVPGEGDVLPALPQHACHGLRGLGRVRRFVVELVAHQNADALLGLGREPGQCVAGLDRVTFKHRDWL